MHDASLAEERELIRTAGAAAALALENERLDAELRARVEELRDSRARIVRGRLTRSAAALERDLHDGAQQRLVALALTLRLARGKIEDDPGGRGALLDEAIAELHEATDELRELARGIHPAVLDRPRAAARRSMPSPAARRVPVERDRAAGASGCPPPVESAAYFVVAEALTNVAKYAQATHAEVEVARATTARVIVEVRDDGVGGADPARRLGPARPGRPASPRSTAASRSRARAGAGTTVRAEIPCA